MIFGLLNGGADPNLTNNDGWTPFMVASQNVIMMLLNNCLSGKFQ